MKAGEDSRGHISIPIMMSRNGEGSSHSGLGSIVSESIASSPNHINGPNERFNFEIPTVDVPIMD